MRLRLGVRYGRTRVGPAAGVADGEGWLGGDAVAGPAAAAGMDTVAGGLRGDVTVGVAFGTSPVSCPGMRRSWA